MTPAFELRRLGPSEAASYQTLRLEGLNLHPEAFGASWEDEVTKPVEWFADRLEHNTVFGGFRDSSVLVGTAGLNASQSRKSRHKGVLFGMYIRPEARGTGLAAALVARVIEEAAKTLEILQLTVVTANPIAIRLYMRAGFTQYGLEPRGLKVGDHYYDELLMMRPLQPHIET